MSRTRLPNLFIHLTALTLFALASFGMLSCANPIMKSQMGTGLAAHSGIHCLPGEDCGMGLIEHIAIWQGMITANLTVNFLVMLLGFLAVAILAKSYKKIFSHNLKPHEVARYLYYERNHRAYQLYNYFRQIFARGILHPKLCA